jgi:ketosteroid isomerase-like protein
MISDMAVSASDRDLLTSASKEIAGSFFDALSRGDFDAAFALTAADGVIHLPQPRQTLLLSEWRTVYEALMASQFPEGCRYEIREVIGEGERVCLRTESCAPMRGGDVYNNRYHWIVGLTDGRISEIHESLDTLYAQQTIHARGWVGRQGDTSQQ